MGRRGGRAGGVKVENIAGRASCGGGKDGGRGGAGCRGGSERGWAGGEQTRSVLVVRGMVEYFWRGGFISKYLMCTY